ncbi:MAG: Glu/Leu/Phe/Val dehydrogenase dimerization domain-containing protein [Phycisphaerales bacterium]|nr:Glu/Leu/Phe/Val dehydrogenase dimerization domain-containing protein [Phycisphaerales bacterium]
MGDVMEFLNELHHLQARFDALKPELWFTVRDPEHGVEGYVVVWTTLNAIGGPLGRIGKGGTRITPTVTIDEIGRLARTQSLKNAAAGLKLGGAKSGLRADPHAENFEETYRRFVRLVAPLLHENGGPWGGLGYDLGGDPIHCMWACDELGSTRGFTGKPIEMGGTDYDHEGIAGLGVAVAGATLLEDRGADIGSTTAAVQGLGAMGAAVARYYTQLGGVVTTISDPRIGGTWRLREPLCDALLDDVTVMDFMAVREHLERDGHEHLPLDAVLYGDEPLLFPCAVQDVIDTHNVPRLHAKYVVEGANNPCTAAARAALHERGIDVIPDFIANPGGAISAYVELTSDISDEENARTGAKVEEAKQMTREMVADNVRQVLELSAAASASPTDAATVLAIRRVFGEA